MSTIPTTQNGQAMYTIMKDGNNVEHKIVNFNNPEMVKNKGLIVIESIRKQKFDKNPNNPTSDFKRHATASNFRVYRDPVTEIIWGIPQGLNQQKNILFKLMQFGDLKQYDLAMAEDRKEWAVMQYHPSLANTPYSKGKPAFKKVDVEEDAVAKIRKIGEKEAAYRIIRDLTHSQMLDMARNVGGISTMGNSLPVIQSKLYDFADSKPEELNRIWAMANRESLTVFKRCLSVGLIHMDLNVGYLWKKATQLGNSEAMAIDFITKNHNLLLAMDAESKLNDAEFQANATEEEKQVVLMVKPEPVIVNNNDISDYAKHLEARIIESEASNKRVEDMFKQFLASQNNVPPVATKTEPNREGGEVGDPIAATTETDELKSLQKQAKAMGMKHAYVTMDKAKILAWMEAQIPTTNA